MQWPHTAHILDYLRCSVVFDNIQDFLNGFNHFYNEFNSNTTNLREKMYHQKRCIKCIVRIKNDFDGIEDNCKNLDLRPFNYCDIKCNVLIENSNYWRNSIFACIYGSLNLFISKKIRTI